MLKKLIIIGIVVFLLWAALQYSVTNIACVGNFAKNFSTHLELSTISRNIYLNFIINTGSLPNKSDEAWGEYIRESMKSHDPTRDPGADPWNNPYRVRETRHMRKSDLFGFTVTSAGPDSIFQTMDDIEVFHGYR
jgi:hypothetical protein